MKKKILISGAGVAGLSAAALLDSSKYDITVVEKSDSYRSMGYIIILWDSAVDVLRDVIGCSVEGINPIDNLSFFGGLDLRSLGSIDIKHGLNTVLRENLMNGLISLVEEGSKDIKMMFSNEILDVEEGERGRVTFLDGTEDDYDLVILSDGVHSTVRDKHFDVQHTIYSQPFAYQWIDDYSESSTVSLMGTVGFDLAIIPVNDKAVLTYFHDKNTTLPKTIEEKVYSMLSDGGKNTKVRIEKNFQDFTIEKILVKKPVNKRLVLVGDSFHANSPTIGFGTSAALGDSYELCKMLNSLDLDNFEQNISKSIEQYVDSRTSRVNKTYNLKRAAEVAMFSKTSRKAELIAFLLAHGGIKVSNLWLKELVSYSGLSFSYSVAVGSAVVRGILNTESPPPRYSGNLPSHFSIACFCRNSGLSVSA